MSDPGLALSTGSLAERLGARLLGSPSVMICGVNSLDQAAPDEISFISDARYARLWPASRAAAAVITEGIEVAGGKAEQPDRRTARKQGSQKVGQPEIFARPLLVVADANLAMALLLQLFAPPESLPDVGIHSTAYVDATVDLGNGVRIGSHVSVDRGCSIGANAVLHPGVRIYADVVIGDGTILHSGCVVRERSQIGCNVILHANVSIGTDGFGYRPAGVEASRQQGIEASSQVADAHSMPRCPDASMPSSPALIKLPHIGNVVLEDEVEIGASSCVDRGKFGSTIIGRGTKIDNLVQIAHNCRIGQWCVIAGQTGISGSVTIGDGVRIGGSVGIADHLTIGDGASIGARSGVMHDVPAGESWLGLPAGPVAKTLRQWAAMRKLPDSRQKS